MSLIVFVALGADRVFWELVNAASCPKCQRTLGIAQQLIRAPMAEYKDPENTILMELKDGTAVIELLPDIAPNHCARMKELALWTI